jgi:hypothetical protein
MHRVSLYLCTDADISLPSWAKPKWKADCWLVRIYSHIKGCRITLSICEWRMRTSRTRPTHETNTIFATLNSSVGIVTGYRLDGRGSNPSRGKFSPFYTAFRPALRATEPRIQWVSGATSPRIKRPGNEADGSFPSSAEDKNGGAIPPLHLCLCLWGWVVT